MVLLDFIFHIITPSNTVTNNNTSPKILLGISITILCISIWYFITKVLKNCKSTWQYHGAEHKVIFTNYENIPITFENCKNAPRIADRCGTIFFVLYIFTCTITIIINLFIKTDMWFCIFTKITFIISYELFSLERNTPVICWLFKLWYLFQEKVFTLEPNEFQLNQAIETFKLLEKAETGKISDDELQKLLKDGKQAKNLFNKLF